MSATVPPVERYDKTRFRITVWPEHPLPHPGHYTRTAYWLDRVSGAIRYDFNAASEDARVPQGGETYLRLYDLDLDDRDAVGGWIAAFGPLGMRADAYGLKDAGSPKGFCWHPAFLAHIDPALAESYAVASRAHDGDFEETLAEFLWGAKCLRDLVTAWRVVAGELALVDAVWQSPLWEYARPGDLETYPWHSVANTAAPRAEQQDGAASLLASYLTDGLEMFFPRVRTPGEGSLGVFGPDIPAYNVMCLELFNHIVERVPYRTCANETCGRLFVRQSGRAAHGQYRTRGVKYCSAECARSQAQRQYRRRRASST